MTRFRHLPGGEHRPGDPDRVHGEGGGQPGAVHSRRTRRRHLLPRHRLAVVRVRRGERALSGTSSRLVDTAYLERDDREGSNSLGHAPKICKGQPLAFLWCLS